LVEVIQLLLKQLSNFCRLARCRSGNGTAREIRFRWTGNPAGHAEIINALGCHSTGLLTQSGRPGRQPTPDKLPRDAGERFEGIGRGFFGKDSGPVGGVFAIAFNSSGDAFMIASARSASDGAGASGGVALSTANARSAADGGAPFMMARVASMFGIYRASSFLLAAPRRPPFSQPRAFTKATASRSRAMHSAMCSAVTGGQPLARR
jgi:hypothetical protein